LQQSLVSSLALAEHAALNAQLTNLVHSTNFPYSLSEYLQQQSQFNY
jgi:hypothetical protein